MTVDDLGHSRIVPDVPVTAGEVCSLTFLYTAGHPIDDSGHVKLVFRYAGDFGTPQFDRPGDLNFCSVQTTGDCRIVPAWHDPGHVRPWGKALFLRVTGGYLDRGDQVRVIFGDRSGGSPGWRMQTFCEATFEFKTLVDPIASYQFKELDQSPTLRIVAGAPERAVCIAPSQVRVGEAFRYHVKREDRWGNPTAPPTPRSHQGFDEPGVRWIEVNEPATGVVCTSNPIAVALQDPGSRPCWADLHGQSEEAIGTNSIEDYFRFARDMALLDIVGHQANDFQVTDEFWDTIRQTADEYTDPDRFVSFPGFEWSGNTPLGGDRNVYFLSADGEISRSSNELLPGGVSRYPVSPTANDLFQHLGQQPARAFCVAHVGGRYADLRTHDANLEVAVEVHSAWGTFEWLVDDALRRGYRVGITASSDGHKGRPGASYPGASRFGSYGGLTCIVATGLNRPSLYTALKDRHFFGTTGIRCLLETRVILSDGRSAAMGDVIEALGASAVLDAQVWGTGAIERVEVRNGLETIHTARAYAANALGRRIKVVWQGAEVRGRARRADWSGHLIVESNRIQHVEPVQCWNPLQTPRQVSDRQVAWESSTTGGSTGCILVLEDAHAGTISIETAQGVCSWHIGSIGLTPLTQHYGGVGKQLEVYRLPDAPSSRGLSIRLPLAGLGSGDNPIFIRMTQEDGHMAWSSPIYLVVS